MPKTTKAEKAAAAAVEAAADAVKDAKRLARKLPKADAKKLKSVLDEVADAVRVTKKQVARHPAKIEKDATAAAVRVEKATKKAKAKLSSAKPAAVTRGAGTGATKRATAVEKSSRRPAEESGVVDENYAPSGDGNAAPAPQAAAPAPSPAASPGSEDLASLTVVQLRERARAAGQPGYSRLRKDQLVALLSA